MNWRRLYAVFHTCLVVGGAATAGATFWAMVIAGISRIAFGLSETSAMTFIFTPLLLGIAIYLVMVLPKSLRRAEMLSDEPKRFGPWFTNRQNDEMD